MRNIPVQTVSSKATVPLASSHDYSCGEIEASAETQFNSTLAKLFSDNQSEFLVHSVARATKYTRVNCTTDI